MKSPDLIQLMPLLDDIVQEKSLCSFQTWHAVKWLREGYCLPPLLPKDGPRDSFKIKDNMTGYRFGKILSEKWPDEIT